MNISSNSVLETRGGCMNDYHTHTQQSSKRTIARLSDRTTINSKTRKGGRGGRGQWRCKHKNNTDGEYGSNAPLTG